MTPYACHQCAHLLLRCSIILPLSKTFTAFGDAESQDLEPANMQRAISRATKVAALHGALYLTANGLLSPEGLLLPSASPRQPPIHSRSTTDSSESAENAEDASSSVSSASSDTLEFARRPGRQATASAQAFLTAYERLQPSVSSSIQTSEPSHVIQVDDHRTSTKSSLFKVSDVLTTGTSSQDQHRFSPSSDYAAEELARRLQEEGGSLPSSPSSGPSVHDLPVAELSLEPKFTHLKSPLPAASKTASIPVNESAGNSTRDRESGNISTCLGPLTHMSPQDVPSTSRPTLTSNSAQAPSAIPAESPPSATTSNNRPSPQAPPVRQVTAAPPMRHEISLELARGFVDFYCHKQSLPKPIVQYATRLNGTMEVHEAQMLVKKRLVGSATGCSRKEASSLAYIEAALGLGRADPEEWQKFVAEENTRKEFEARSAMLVKNFPGADFIPTVELRFSDRLDEALRGLKDDASHSELYQQAIKSQERTALRLETERKRLAAIKGNHLGKSVADTATMYHPIDNYQYEDSMRADRLKRKSYDLQCRQDAFNRNPKYAQMRESRSALPVSGYRQRLLDCIAENPVVIVMAATGSGKTTQIPQIILDDAISKGEGASINIVCTQPRRIAAISVAQRIADERGESVGQSVGYHVRFENKFPEPDGSILFMTSGILLKRMQVSLHDAASGKSSFLDDVTHVVVDEVHERELNVDLLLFILRRHLEERRQMNKPGFKIILMCVWGMGDYSNAC